MNGWIEAVGWTLVHFVWQGALIGAATAAVLRTMRGARPQQRYLLACAALLLCVLWPALQLFERMRELGPVYATPIAAAAREAATAPAWALRRHLDWIVAAWLLGAAGLALRTVAGLAWIGRAARDGRCDAAWQARLETLARTMGVARTVRLRIVDGIAGPVTALWWRPVVLVPAALMSGMPPDLLQALLAHELAHIRRHDYLVNLLQNIVETLLFYHPAVWWISRRIRHERELIADDLAAAHAGGPRQLARALSELEKRQFTHPEPALAANGGDTMERITQLLRPALRPALRTSLATALPALALAGACLAGLAHANGATPNLDGTVENPDKRAVVDFSTCKKPVWPQASLAAQNTGTVTLRFLVDKDGGVADSRVHKSSGHPALDEAAREGITKCHFKPAIAKKQPVKSWVMVQYVWLLE